MKKLFAAQLVAFNEDNTINEAGTRAIVRHNIEVNHVDGLYVGGSSGENFMLSTDEKKQIFKFVFDEVNGAVELIAQIGSVNLNESIELAQYVKALGYKTISAVTPFYYPFGFDEIRDYYKAIVTSAELDLIVYSIPALTGTSLTLDQFGELLALPHVIGVKFTAGDFYLLERLRSRFPDILIYSGFDEMLLPGLSLGVDGAIGSTFTVNAERARQTMIAVEAGDMKSAYKYQRESNDLIAAILDNGLYSTLKLLLQDMGVDAGYCKAPMKKPTEKMITRAHEIYHTYLEK